MNFKSIINFYAKYFFSIFSRMIEDWISNPCHALWLSLWIFIELWEIYGLGYSRYTCYIVQLPYVGLYIIDWGFWILRIYKSTRCLYSTLSNNTREKFNQEKCLRRYCSVSSKYKAVNQIRNWWELLLNWTWSIYYIRSKKTFRRFNMVSRHASRH